MAYLEMKAHPRRIPRLSGAPEVDAYTQIPRQKGFVRASHGNSPKLNLDTSFAFSMRTYSTSVCYMTPLSY